MAEASVTLGAVSRVLRSAGLLEAERGPEDVAVRGVSQDSRAVRPGDLFLAWKGTESDAHDFVDDAAAAGAVAAVVERPVDADLPQLVVSDGRRAAALAAHHVMGAPSDRMTVVGVTGTNGKTTTALLARHVLEARGPAAAVGTLGVVDDDGARPGTEGLTTPGPVQVAVWLWQLANDGMRAVVMEASSHALEQRRLDGVRFEMGLFTNLTQDHLDYHVDLASYFGAKARLVELVAPGGTLIVNRDDRGWDELDVGGRTLRTFAVDADADVRAERVSLSAAGSRFVLVVDGARAEVALPLPGAYNVENALAAAAIAVVAGMGVEEIAARLASAPQVPGRRLIVLFGAGGDRDRAKRRPMAEAVRRFADVVVLTSDNPRTEDPERILDDLAEGLMGVEYARIADRRAAILHALSSARPGDTVLLAGKGHETYQVVGREKRPFDERVVVRECLAALGAA